MAGWIKLHRKLTEWEWYSDVNTSRLFVHLLLVANHKDNQWRGIDIKRGQRLTSISKLASEINLSVKNVRTSIKRLKSTNEVASHSSAQHTVLTIINYDYYQDEASEVASEGQTSGKQVASKRQTSGKQVASKRQTSGKQVATNKNEENDKNEKNEVIKPMSAKANLAFEIFTYWCDVMGKSISNSKLTPKREKAIKDRLKQGYTIDQIKTAIFNCSNDPFSMGQNDRGKAFNDLELICRNGEKLESFFSPTGDAINQLSLGNSGDWHTEPNNLPNY